MAGLISPYDTMSIVDAIKDFVLGIDLISVDKARTVFDQALNQCDKDQNGYLNARELISIFRKLVK